MQTDSLLNQPRAREVDLASLRSGTWTRQAPIKARRPPFDRLTIGLHWGTILLVLVLFASAWLTRQSHFTPILLQIHRSSGVTIWVVTALRLAWRVTKASLPPFPKQISKLHRATAKLTEYGLYALLLGEPATGLAHHAVWWASIRSIFMAVSGTHAPGFDATSRVSFFS